MTVLLTGAAGFIGFHVAEALLARGDSVVGVDNLNAYYDPALKQERLDHLGKRSGFYFRNADITDGVGLASLLDEREGVDRIIHLAAQPGVLYSFKDPDSYIHSNITGQMAILEVARKCGGLRHLVFASSSSVYGGSDRLPFALDDPVDRPLSLYGATKRAGELMAHSYSHLYGVPATGLRFFTVYGRWGRPDMAAWGFTEAVLDDQPITLRNEGAMKRDFTHVDDIVPGVLAALDRPPAGEGGATPFALYNLGNSRPEPLDRFIAIIEEAAGRKADIQRVSGAAGEPAETFADIAASRRDLGFEPRVTLDEGLTDFVAWFRARREA